MEQSEPSRSRAGASFNGEVSIAMLRDRLGAARGCTQKAPFPRILSENSSSALQRFGDDQLGATKRLSEWDSRRGGCAASRLMTLKETRLRADTNCSGNGFGGMPAHRVMIQAPQPRLRPGLQEAQRQPSVGRALTRPTAIDTNLRHLDPWLLQPPVSARRNAQSLTSYQAHPTPRMENGPALHWNKLWRAATLDCFRLNRLESREPFTAACFALPPLLDLGPTAHERIKNFNKRAVVNFTEPAFRRCLINPDQIEFQRPCKDDPKGWGGVGWPSHPPLPHGGRVAWGRGGPRGLPWARPCWHTPQAAGPRLAWVCCGGVAAGGGAPDWAPPPPPLLTTRPSQPLPARQGMRMGSRKVRAVLGGSRHGGGRTGRRCGPGW